MTKPQYLASIAVCLTILAATGSGALAQGPTPEDLTPKRPTYTTADELREVCGPYLKPVDPQLRKMPQRAEYFLFIVPYLDSEDAELRGAAVDILAQLMRVGRHIRASAFKQYVSRDYPINVRVVALAHSLYGVPGAGEAVSHTERRAEMEAAWTETINDIAESPVTPANLDVLAFALNVHNDCVALIKPDNQPLMMRRLLALMSAGTRDDRRRVIDLICQLPMDAAASEVLAWYRVEPDAGARAVCVERIGVLSGRLSFFHGQPSSADKLRTLKPILELAAQDPDPEIAKKAKAALEKANAFLEKSKALQDTGNE